MENLLKKYFTAHVNKHPQSPCIEWEGKVYDYAAVNSIAVKIQAVIEGLNISNKCIIVPNDRSLYNYAAVLAIQFSGNAFMPVDGDWPPARIAEVIKLVQPAAVVVQLPVANSLAEKLLTAGMHPIPQIDPALLSISGRFVSAAADYIQIAYILFTSGSTGVPKGVPVSISNLNCFLQQVTEKYDFTPADRFLQVYELTFDVAYFSFFIPMTVGACCCLLGQQAGVSKSLCIVSDLIDRKISVVSMVPTVIHLAGKYIFGQQAASVRHCFFIGDALYHSEALCWQQFIPQGQIHNFYGPTEATIACADYLWQPDAPEAHVHNDVVCIGNLFSNFDYVIINEDRIEAGVDAEGELALCSGQVVKGYLGGVQPEKFLLLPVQPGRTAPFYRTGDMVRKTKDGNLLFLGRIDHQVKVNGYRIELAEVQMAIARVTKRKAIVVKKKLIHGHAGLAAYIEGGTMDVELIKAALAQILPAYMVPEQFDFMNQLPLNANGKTDYSTLQS